MLDKIRAAGWHGGTFSTGEAQRGGISPRTLYAPGRMLG